jgi:hypothetical protein
LAQEKQCLNELYDIVKSIYAQVCILRSHIDKKRPGPLPQDDIDKIRNFGENCKQAFTELLARYGFEAEKLFTEGEDQEDGVGEDELSEEHQPAEGEDEEVRDGEAEGEDEGEDEEEDDGETEGEDEGEDTEEDAEEDEDEDESEDGEEHNEEDEEEHSGVTYELIDGLIYEVTYEWIDAEDSEEDEEEHEGDYEGDYQDGYEAEDDGEDEGNDQGHAMQSPVQPTAFTFNLPIIGGRKRGREDDADEEEPAAKRVFR